jgi:hypothetical protein
MSTPTILRRDSAAPANDAEYTLAPDVAVILMADGSARLIDMGDRFYSLSPVAALMLHETLHLGTAAAAQRVGVEYSIDLAKAEADLKGFLTTLEQRGILQRRGGDVRPRSSPGACLAAWLLKVVVRLLPWRRARAVALLSAAKVSCRLFGWARTVAAWQGQFPPAAGPIATDETETSVRAIDEAVCGAAAANPLGVACKERALSCWALARTAGLPAALVIGVDLFPLTGHCWCEVGPWVLSDHSENVTPYIPALRYQ